MYQGFITTYKRTEMTIAIKNIQILLPHGAFYHRVMLSLHWSWLKSLSNEDVFKCEIECLNDMKTLNIHVELKENKK